MYTPPYWVICISDAKVAWWVPSKRHFGRCLTKIIWERSWSPLHRKEITYSLRNLRHPMHLKVCIQQMFLKLHFPEVLIEPPALFLKTVKFRTPRRCRGGDANHRYGCHTSIKIWIEKGKFESYPECIVWHSNKGLIQPKMILQTNVKICNR